MRPNGCIPAAFGSDDIKTGGPCGAARSAQSLGTNYFRFEIGR
jgi:hypothetical protein